MKATVKQKAILTFLHKSGEITFIQVRELVDDENSIHYRKKPHCWGKMNWILKYPFGMEPNNAICRCEFGAMKCNLLTRKNKRNATTSTGN